MSNAMKLLGLCIAAMLAFGALSAASASASQPEFEPKSGEFPVGFSGEGGKGAMETLEGDRVECDSSEVVNGEVTGPFNTEAEAVVFFGCEDPGTGTSCESEGGAEGEIETATAVNGELFYVGSVKAEVGVWLWPASGNVFAKFECGPVDVTVYATVNGGKGKGGVVAVLTPTNKFTTKFTLTFSQEGGVQEPDAYWDDNCEEVADYLESEGLGFFGSGWERQQSGLEGTAKLTTEESVRVNATECE